MKAVVLLSGGIDSCVLLALALSKGQTCTALSYHYGQRHLIELESAKKIASYYGVPHSILTIDPSVFQSANSALTDFSIPVNPITAYVPSRNLIFLSLAASFAEARGASMVYFGGNADDAPHFPDCTTRFIDAIQAAIAFGAKTPVSIQAPLTSMSKKEVKALGRTLHAPLDLTWSCYQPTEESRPCGKCPACLLASEYTAST